MNIFRVFRVMHTVLYSMILKNLIVNWIIDYSNNEILFIFIYNSFYYNLPSVGWDGRSTSMHSERTKSRFSVKNQTAR